MRRASAIVALSLLAGCSFSPTGFNYGGLARAARVDRSRPTEAEIAAAASMRPQLTFPFRLAVWFRPPDLWQWSEHRFQWQDEDREGILRALEPLVHREIVSEILPIADAVVTGDEVRGARFAAARLGADVVLVVTGVSAVDRYSTAAALAYATIVGLWVVPGTRADGVCMVTSSLWDVRSGYLYGADEARSKFATERPLMLLRDEEAVEGAKRAALFSLALDLQKRVGNLQATVALAQKRAGP